MRRYFFERLLGLGVHVGATSETVNHAIITSHGGFDAGLANTAN